MSILRSVLLPAIACAHMKDEKQGNTVVITQNEESAKRLFHTMCAEIRIQERDFSPREQLAAYRVQDKFARFRNGSTVRVLHCGEIERLRGCYLDAVILDDVDIDMEYKNSHIGIGGM